MNSLPEFQEVWPPSIKYRRYETFFNRNCTDLFGTLGDILILEENAGERWLSIYRKTLSPDNVVYENILTVYPDRDVLLEIVEGGGNRFFRRVPLTPPFLDLVLREHGISLAEFLEKSTT